MGVAVKSYFSAFLYLNAQLFHSFFLPRKFLCFSFVLASINIQSIIGVPMKLKHEESSSPSSSCSSSSSPIKFLMSRHQCNTSIFGLSFSFIFSLWCLLLFYIKLRLVHGTGGLLHFPFHFLYLTLHFFFLIILRF